MGSCESEGDSPVKTRAAVLHAFGADLAVEEISLAEVGPDEVLIRTVASGVCHTDRTMQGGANALPLPLVLGHEVAGVVEQVGDRVTEFVVGDRVATCASSFCGRCRWCQTGHLNHCEDRRRARPAGQPPRVTQGDVPVEPFVGLGGFAEHILVDRSAVVTLPDAMPLDRACLLGCAVVTGLGAVRHTAQVRSGETVAVIGCGGVGLNVIQGARLVGASRIIAIDRLPAKLDRARLFGATDVVDASSTDPVAVVRELTGSGVDHVFDVVGLTSTLAQGFAMLDTRGLLTMVGVPHPDVRLDVPAVDLLLEKRIQGTKMGSTRFRLDIPLYAQMYLDGRLMLDELISERVSLNDVNAALADLDNPIGARAVLTFGPEE